jgi:Zn-dependent protease with chaperone function
MPSSIGFLYNNPVIKIVGGAAYGAYDFVLPKNPATKRRGFHVIPTRVEKFLGAALYPTHLANAGGYIDVKNCPNEKHREYAQLVKEIGEKLAAYSPRAGLDFEFEVVNSPEDNAWCLPGGKIAINLGLIERLSKTTEKYGLITSFTLEDKIAAVLSHEITHATARHSGRTIEFRLFLVTAFVVVKYAVDYFINRYYKKERESYNNEIESFKKSPKSADQIQELLKQNETMKHIENLKKINSWVFDHMASLCIRGLTLCAGRAHELEADKYGMHLLYNIYGMKPESAVWLQEYFKAMHPQKAGISWIDRIVHVFTGTHPTLDERLAANKKTLEELKTLNLV